MVVVILALTLATHCIGCHLNSIVFSLNGCPTPLAAAHLVPGHVLNVQYCFIHFIALMDNSSTLLPCRITLHLKDGIMFFPCTCRFRLDSRPDFSFHFGFDLSFNLHFSLMFFQNVLIQPLGNEIKSSFFHFVLILSSS